MATLVVNQTLGPYTTIQSAVNAAGPTDDISITDSATYTESVVPNGALDPIVLSAAAGQTPVVDGGGALGIGISVFHGSSITGIEVSNFTVDGISGNGANRRFSVADCYIHDCGADGIRRITGAIGNVQTVTRTIVADVGGIGIRVEGDYVTVTNCLVVRPTGATYGITNGWASGVVEFCTVAGCSGFGHIGIITSGQAAIGCITTGDGQGIGIQSVPASSYCCAYNHNTAFTAGAGTGDITTDPLFADAGSDDYRLTASSPCLDAVVVYAGSVVDDLLGVARPHAAFRDMGAYELIYQLILDSVTVQTNTTLLADFNLPPTAATVEDAADWTAVPIGLAATVTPLSAVVQVDTTQVLVTVDPELTAGASYTVTAVNAANASGAASPNFKVVSVPGAMVAAATSEFPARLLPTVLHTMGREAQSLNGTPMTKLRNALSPTATQADVESTHGMADSGRVWCHGLLFTYTGRTAQTLTGLSAAVPRLLTIPAGTAVVFDWSSLTAPLSDEESEAISALNSTLFDTVILRSEGTALERLAKLYGIPKPRAWDEASWRIGLHAAGLGPRGTPGVTQAFLEGIYTFANTTFEVTQAAANPQRITATAGAGTFNQTHIGRWVRIGTGIYYTVGPQDVVTDGGTRVELASIATARWNAADWSGFAATATVTATFLPFFICEPTPGSQEPKAVGDPCVVKVKIFDASLTTVPPTYMQPDTQFLLYDAEAAPFVVGETVEGVTSRTSGIIRNLTDDGTTGVLELIRLTDGGNFIDNETLTGSIAGSAVANGRLGDLLIAYDGEVAGGFAVGNVIDGTAAVPSPMQATIRGLQDNGVDGLIVAEYTSGNIALDNEDLEVGAVVKGVVNGAIDALVRPSGEPFGGQIQASEFEVGDPNGVGPHPPYMRSGKVAPEASAAVKSILPVGYWAKLSDGLA